MERLRLWSKLPGGLRVSVLTVEMGVSPLQRLPLSGACLVAQEQPVVEPQVTHFRQVPFLTMVKLPQLPQASPV